MARKSANPGSSQSDNLPPSLVEARRKVAELFHARVTKILEVVLRRWEQKVLEDPAYEAKPSDIVGIMQALRASEDLLATYSNLGVMLENTRTELKRLEDQFLSLLSAPPAG